MMPRIHTIKMPATANAPCCLLHSQNYSTSSDAPTQDPREPQRPMSVFRNGRQLHNWTPPPNFPLPTLPLRKKKRKKNHQVVKSKAKIKLQTVHRDNKRASGKAEGKPLAAHLGCRAHGRVASNRLCCRTVWRGRGRGRGGESGSSPPRGQRGPGSQGGPPAGTPLPRVERASSDRPRRRRAQTKRAGGSSRAVAAGSHPNGGASGQRQAPL